MKILLALGLMGLTLVGCAKQQESNFNKEIQAHEAPPRWEVITSKDEMRKTEQKFLAIESINSANFKFPYDGGSKLTLVLTDTNSDEPRVILVIDKGQYDCSMRACYGAAKFGDSPVQDLEFQEGVSKEILVFTGNSKAFVANIRKFKKVIIELPFYQEGNHQFTFNTEGFSAEEPKIQ